MHQVIPMHDICPYQLIDTSLTPFLASWTAKSQAMESSSKYSISSF